MIRIIGLTLLLIGTFMAAPARAVPCSATSSFMARLESVTATSSSCRAALRNPNGNSRQVCTVCRVTQNKLGALQRSYKAQKACLKGDPVFRARINRLLAYRSDIKKLRKLCGG